ncbi:MAG: DsbA family oxidoreductase [Candidatus Hodarchaeales archaeon]|jgi:predicted DsbA family dithiol-disulfide isomerase
MKNKEINLEVTVFSDYICPFCYIGKDRVENIKKDFPEAKITWKMIEIHPELPKDGIKTKSISSPYLNVVWESVEKMAKESNIKMKIPDILANSKIAIYVSEFAKKVGKFQEFHALLLDEYWVNGNNISDINIILGIATRIGLNSSELEEFLHNGNGEEILKRNLEESYDHLITGVPSFVINDKVIIGAQPYHLIKKVIEREILTANETNFTPI